MRLEVHLELVDVERKSESLSLEVLKKGGEGEGVGPTFLSNLLFSFSLWNTEQNIGVVIDY